MKQLKKKIHTNIQTISEFLDFNFRNFNRKITFLVCHNTNVQSSRTVYNSVVFQQLSHVKIKWVGRNTSFFLSTNFRKYSGNAIEIRHVQCVMHKIH